MQSEIILPLLEKALKVLTIIKLTLIVALIAAVVFFIAIGMYCILDMVTSAWV